MSARRAPRGGGGGGGGGGYYGSTDRSMERSMAASAAEAREARQLVAVQSTVRDVQGQLQELEASARKGIDAGSDAAQAAARVQQELKTTAKHFFREQARDRDTLRQTEQQRTKEVQRQEHEADAGHLPGPPLLPAPCRALGEERAPER